MLNFASAALIIKLHRHRMQPPFAFIIRVITESGLIYALATTVLVCAVFIRDVPNGTKYPTKIICAIVRSTPNGYFDPRYSFWSDSPSCGITFDLILIRLAQNRPASARPGN